MANSLYTPAQASRSVLAALRYLTVLGRTVRQDFSAEFVAGVGQTINVRGPVSVGAARVYTQANRTARDAIVFDDITDVFYPVTIQDQVYKAVRLPDDFATFTLVSLEQQVLIPQARAVVDRLNAFLISRMQAISPVDASVPAVAADGSNILAVLVALRRVLNARRVPIENRFVAVGPAIEAAFLSNALLQKTNESGTDAMLRNATIGQLFGFTIIADPTLPDYYGVAYNQDAFALATRPSKNPEGAAKSATIAQDGFALRWLEHYNPLQLEDQSVVDTFVGTATLDPLRAVSFGAALVGTTITVAPPTATIAVGAKLTLAVTDASGNTIPNRLVAWSTNNAARATVDADGIVTGVATGTAATITATFQTRTGTSAVTVS